MRSDRNAARLVHATQGGPGSRRDGRSAQDAPFRRRTRGVEPPRGRTHRRGRRPRARAPPALWRAPTARPGPTSPLTGWAHPLSHQARACRRQASSDDAAREIMARLSALIPPPRYPLVRFHGVLGPRSAWRRDVVPKQPGRSCPPEHSGKEAREPRRGDLQQPPRATQPSRGGADPTEGSWLFTPLAARPEPRVSTAPSAAPSAPGTQLILPALLPSSPGANAIGRPFAAPQNAARSTATPTKTTLLAPNILSVQHWTRLAEGELYAASRRIAWGPLLKRTFAVDVQECPTCHGRLRIIGSVVDPKAARAILLQLALPTSAPVPTRARDPTELEWSEEEQQRGA
jgi:hypothetical protein